MNARHDQVQSVTIAATHRDEVQTITTAAPAIVGVQLMTTSADEGTTVTGNFALQFPEVQTLTLSAPAAVTSGTFSLTYTSKLADGSGGLNSGTTATTSPCLDWHAEAQDVGIICYTNCRGWFILVELLHSALLDAVRSRGGFVVLEKTAQCSCSGHRSHSPSCS